MHIPQGFWKDQLGDIDVIAHDGVLHAFYLCTPSHDRVGHLTSTDGLNWQEQPAALHTGAPGSFDDDQIWTMGVFPHAGKFFMLYTGLAMKEQGKVQRIGLATSPDLFTWVRHSTEPVAQSDPRWYDTRMGPKSRIDWRDPWVFHEHGLFHCLITARAATGPENRKGCIGYMVSVDGCHWEVKPPLGIPGTLYDFETLAVAKLANRYYLTGIAGRDSFSLATSIYRVADAITGPYRRIGHGDLLPINNQVFKPVVFAGQTLYFHNLKGIADWSSGAGRSLTTIAPPKVADTGHDGSLILRPFTHWDKVASHPSTTLTPQDLFTASIHVQSQWSLTGDALRGGTNIGVASFLLAPQFQSLVMTASITHHDAPEFGLLLRASPVEGAEDATYISLTPSLRRVQLYTLAPFHKTPCADVTYRWRPRKLIQEFASDRPWAARLTLQIVAFGPYVEVSVDNHVLISAITMARPNGHIGFFVEDAMIDIHNLHLLPLNPPDCLPR